MTVRNKIAGSGVALLAGAIAIPIGVALAAEQVDNAPVPSPDYLGTGPAEIRASLQARGCELREIEREDGYFEVEARRNGTEWEVYVDAETGTIIRREPEDD